MTTVLCHQLAPVVGDLAGNCARILAAVEAAAHADVIVLPELATSGYVFDSTAEAQSLAITLDHPFFTACSALLTRDQLVVLGFCEDGGDGVLHNSAAIIGADGIRLAYRKVHLWDSEKLFFTPGIEPPRTLETTHGTLGLIICYDLEFPELTRDLALAGAELMVIPTNWPLMTTPVGERAAEVVIAMAAARVNRMFIACCDRTGVERGQQWTAGTTIVSHEGWVLGVPGDDGVVEAELELALARDKRISERNDVLADRRPDVYGTGALTS